MLVYVGVDDIDLAVSGPSWDSLSRVEISAATGSEINRVMVPVNYGPFTVPGHIGYRKHVVERGDTLSAIAVRTGG
ncbi:MAG TPA: LysM domain-containing protein [Pseudonocardiaceae bacterium]|nr:LysM domain-containing protein [Pseudonocardiaceae bacterium]